MSLSTLYMRSGDGFLLVFSLTSVESISELHTIREQIMRIKEATLIPGKEQRVPIVLVGNKLDLTHERQVSREVAVHLSRSWGGVRGCSSALCSLSSLMRLTSPHHQVPYYETSARKEINVRTRLLRSCPSVHALTARTLPLPAVLPLQVNAIFEDVVRQ